MPDLSDGRKLQAGREDVFGMCTATVPEATLDVASHYPFNPERLRLLVDGTQQFPS